MANGLENVNNNEKKAQEKEQSKEKSKQKEQEKPKEKSKAKEHNKLSVLETHGYSVGRSVGSGSYATVKVKKTVQYEFLNYTKHANQGRVWFQGIF